MRERCVIVRTTKYGYKYDIVSGTPEAYHPLDIWASGFRPTMKWAKRAGQFRLDILENAERRKAARDQRVHELNHGK